MSELNYGINVENLLHDLSQNESSDIGEFDVYVEDEQGQEGCASIDITLLASDALKVIASLKSQHAALLGGFAEAIRHKDKLAAELNVMAAENAMLKGGIGFFSYGTDSGFEEHSSAEKAIAAADSDIDYYRGDACDGWSEETDRTVWGVIMQRATVTGLRAVTDDDNCDPSIKEWCDYTLLPKVETPATEAYLNSVRGEGVEAFAHQQRVIADATPAAAFQRDRRFAAGLAEDFAAQLRASKDGE